MKKRKRKTAGSRRNTRLSSSQLWTGSEFLRLRDTHTHTGAHTPALLFMIMCHVSVLPPRRTRPLPPATPPRPSSVRLVILNGFHMELWSGLVSHVTADTSSSCRMKHFYFRSGARAPHPRQFGLIYRLLNFLSENWQRRWRCPTLFIFSPSFPPTL